VVKRAVARMLLQYQNSLTIEGFAGHFPMKTFGG
jgi:hypothetical protein